VGWVGWITEPARALVDDDVVALDAGSDFFLADTAILLHPQDAASLRATVERLADFYAGGFGGPSIVMSPWPTPPLDDLGCGLVGHPPFILRPQGEAPPPDPDGLKIVETHDARTQADWASPCTSAWATRECPASRAGPPAGTGRERDPAPGEPGAGHSIEGSG